MIEQQQDSAPESAVDTPVTPVVQEQPATVEGQTEQVAETDEQKNERLVQEREERAKKRNDSIQKRFNELTAEKRELMELVKKLSEREAPKPQEQDPDKRPERGDFDSYEDFIRADARWVAREEWKAQEAKRQETERVTIAQRQAAELVHRLESDISSARKELPDFDDVVQNLDFEVPMSMVGAIASSDSPGRVLHALGQNPDEARRIAALPPFLQAKAIGKIEAALSKQVVPQVSAAPKPGAPVGIRSGPVEKDPKDMTYDEFVKFRRKQIAARR